MPLVRTLARPKLQAQDLKPPWESWELDVAFFTALSQWTLDNPETTLDRVLENISIGIENGKQLFTLIPNAPFPARDLITALAHLVKLGVVCFFLTWPRFIEHY